MKKFIVIIGVIVSLFVLGKLGAFEDIKKWMDSSPSNAAEVATPAPHVQKRVSLQAVIVPGKPPTVLSRECDGRYSIYWKVEPGKKVMIAFKTFNGVLLSPSGDLVVLGRPETWGIEEGGKDLTVSIDLNKVESILFAVPNRWIEGGQGWLGNRDRFVPGEKVAVHVYTE